MSAGATLFCKAVDRAALMAFLSMARDLEDEATPLPCDDYDPGYDDNSNKESSDQLRG